MTNSELDAEVILMEEALDNGTITKAEYDENMRMIDKKRHELEELNKDRKKKWISKLRK